MKNIQNLIDLSKETNWSLTDNFSVYFSFPETPDGVSKYTFDFKKFTHLENIEDIFQMSVTTVNVPDMRSGEITSVLGGEYRIQNKMFELFRFSVTFKDFNNHVLYRYFQMLWAASQYEYLDNVKIGVFITSGDFDDVIFSSPECLIENVSQLTYDQGNTQIAEFSVEFKTATVSNMTLREFGNIKYAEKFKKRDEK